MFRLGRKEKAYRRVLFGEDGAGQFCLKQEAYMRGAKSRAEAIFNWGGG